MGPAGRLYKSRHLRKKGEVRYNGHSRREFNMARTIALVDQLDQHIPNLTVRETLEFAHLCQVGPGLTPAMRPTSCTVLWVHRDACPMVLLLQSWLSSRQGLKARQAPWSCD